MTCTLLLISSSAVAVESESIKERVASVSPVADTVVKTEKLHRSANMTYKVAGKRYYPLKKYLALAKLAMHHGMDQVFMVAKPLMVSVLI